MEAGCSGFLRDAKDVWIASFTKKPKGDSKRKDLSDLVGARETLGQDLLGGRESHYLKAVSLLRRGKMQV